MIATVRGVAPFIDRSGRWWLALYFASTVVASALETFGVGMVFVFFQAALEPEKLRGLPLVGNLVPSGEIASQARFIAGVSLVVFLVFLLRTCSQVAVVWLGQDIRRKLQLKLANELFRGYLRQPYVWHLGKKASELYFNISSNTGTVVQNVFLGFVELVGSLALLVFFMLTLGWLKPVETAVAFLLVAAVAGIYLAVVHRRSLQWGEAIVEAGEASVGSVMEPLRGIKTVKVLGIEKHFESMFDARMTWYLAMVLRQGLAQQAPRMLMELVLVTALLGTVTAAFAYGQTVAEIIPTMALFGAAAYRLVPTAARVASLLQQFRFSAPALDAVLSDLRAIRQRGNPVLPAGPEVRTFKSLRLIDVEFRYPESSRAAVSQVNLDIERGQLVAFVGASGAGKTTLADLILGLLRPSSGRMLLDDREFAAAPPRLFGFVPQEPFVAVGSLQKNVAFAAAGEKIDLDAVKRAVEMAAFSDVVARLPDGLGTTVGEGATGLSGGERQRLGLARTLYHDPQILVLDEPTSALDSVTEARVSAALHALRGTKTVIVIAHRLSTIRDFDRIVFMRDGRIAAVGTFGELYAGQADFRDMADRLSTQPETQSEKAGNMLERAT